VTTSRNEGDAFGAGAAAAATEAAVEAVQDTVDRLTLVANASEALSSTLEIEAGLRRVCRVLVPDLADWCAIDLPDESEPGRLRRVVLEHRDSTAPPPSSFEVLLPELGDASTAPVARAMRAAGPVMTTDFPDPDGAGDPLYRAELHTFRRLGARRAISVPLRARHEVLGVLTLVRTGPEDLDEQDRQPLIEDLAHRIAITVDNARLHAMAARTAEHLQRCLLPELPQAGPLELAARYEPAQSTAEIGGDWYDAFLLPDGALSLIIGDVAGHDLQAAVAMSQMRNMLRGIACDRKEPPGKILGRLDAAGLILYPKQLLTCLYALVSQTDPQGPWILHYAAAGHPPPLLITADGEARFLSEGRSPLLGVLPGLMRADAVETLPPDSTIVLYTDGLIERRGEVLDDGLERLRRYAGTLGTASPREICDELMARLGQAGMDDIAIICVRIPPLAAGAGPASGA
jgi:phosphoserine phosphatase RsbU/P